MAEGVDLATGQFRGLSKADEFGPGDQVRGDHHYLKPGLVFGIVSTGHFAHAGGFGLSDPVLDPGVLAVSQLQSLDFVVDGALFGVGDKRGDPQPIGVSEAQLGYGVGPFLPEDEPGACWSGVQVDQSGGFSHPRPLTDLVAGLDGWHPVICGNRLVFDDGLDPVINGEAERELDLLAVTVSSEGLGSPGTIRAHQHPRRRIYIGAYMGGQRFDGLVEDADVIFCGVASGVAWSQNPGQGFSTGDLTTIKEHQQRMEAESALPGGRGVLLLFSGRW